MKCPYCGADAHRATGEAIYPHRPELHGKRFYRCVPCDAYVGCHGTTVIPLGTLANAELRWARMEAHEAFDPIWKTGGVSRPLAYEWLALQLGIPPRQCHIALFTTEQCAATVTAVKAYVARVTTVTQTTF